MARLAVARRVDIVEWVRWYVVEQHNVDMRIGTPILRRIRRRLEAHKYREF